MLRNTWLLVAVLVAFAGPGVAQAQTVLPREVRERILQTVVDVRPYDSTLDRFVGTGGSGTIISPDGYVLTNFHVIGDDVSGFAHTWHGIFLTDPRAPDQAPAFTYWARFVAGDARHDLALVQIVEDAEENPLPPNFSFLSMPVGDSNTLIPGDPITVVGYPGISGATITFTSGIVSGFLGEDLTVGGKQWIKTDAKLARGNSGGAAFDENGVLIGIPTLRLQTEDEGYIEQQDYLRPIALAWPLLSAHVANVNRIGGVGSQVAGIVPDAANPLAPSSIAVAPLVPDAPSVPYVPNVPDAPTPVGASGFSERGELAAGDETLGSGEFVDAIEVDAVAGVPVEVVLTSSAFDAYLLVVAPDGSVVLEVDDTPGQGSDVAERFVPEATGTYVIAVTSYAVGETGAYDLRVAGAVRTPVIARTPEPTPAGGALLSERGTLTSDDFVLDGGEYVDVFSLDLVAGVPVSIELTSTEFDAYLVVLGPDDLVALEVDDSAGYGLNVAETFVPSVDGTYLIAVTSAFAAETGGYDLQVRYGASVAPPGGAPAGPATTPPSSAGPRSTGGLGSGSGVVGPVTLGEQVRAELAGAGDRVAFHTYVVEVPAGTAQLTVEMAADVDLDLFLKFGTEIESLAEGGDWDYRDIDLANRAAFTIAAPTPGPWYVDVVWINGNGLARYTLRAR